MYTFLGCISGSEGVLFFGPMFMLFLLEIALCIIYIQDCRKAGLLPIRKGNRGRGDASGLEVTKA